MSRYPNAIGCASLSNVSVGVPDSDEGNMSNARSPDCHAAHHQVSKQKTQKESEKMEPSLLSTTVSLLAVWERSKFGLFVRNLFSCIRKAQGTLALCTLICGYVQRAQAYTVVTLSTGVPTAIEQEFICNTTSQFNTVYVKNPLAANTYTIKLLGDNTNYNPLPTNADLLKYIVTVDSYNYVYGFVAGQYWERKQDLNMAGNYVLLCSSPTAFTLVQSTTMTWNPKTCQDVLGTLNSSIYQQYYSTPTVIGGY